MSKEHDNRELMSGVVKEALIGEPTRTEKYRALKLRKERREEFLSRAEILLQEYGEESIDKYGVRIWRTPQINLGNNSGVVNVYLVKYVYFADEVIEKTVGIAMDTPKERFLFRVDQSCISYLPKSPLRTKIRNHLEAMATNDQVLGGLQMLEFIEENLRDNLVK